MKSYDLCIVGDFIKLLTLVVEGDAADVGVGLGIVVPHEGREPRQEDVADYPKSPHIWWWCDDGGGGVVNGGGVYDGGGGGDGNGGDI